MTREYLESNFVSFTRETSRRPQTCPCTVKVWWGVRKPSRASHCGQYPTSPLQSGPRPILVSRKKSLPSVGNVSVVSILNVVLFPAPFTPNSPKQVAAWTPKVKFWTATFVPETPWYSLRKFITRTTSRFEQLSTRDRSFETSSSSCLGGSFLFL